MDVNLFTGFPTSWREKINIDKKVKVLQTEINLYKLKG